MHRHIGIYAGTFDPIHAGHLAFAQEAQQFFGLDQVVLLPEAEPRNKPGVAPLSGRMAHVQREIAAFPGLLAMQLAARRFTVHDALPELYATFGREGLVFLFGSDVAPSFVHWPGIEYLLRRHVLAIGLRTQDTEAHLEQTYRTPIRWAALRTAIPHLSSTQIRRQLSMADVSVIRP